MWFFLSPVQKAEKPRARKGGKPRTIQTPAYKKLLNLSKNEYGTMHVNLVSGITTFKKRVSDKELGDAWESGDWSKTMALIPWDKLPDDLASAVSALPPVIEQAGKISIDHLPAPMKSLRWDLKNPHIRTYIHQRTGELIRGIQADTQEIVQHAVARSFSETLSPRQVAKLIKSSIGLYPAQERALANYRAGLLKANVVGHRLDQLTDKYEHKLLDYRSKMIARTEIRGATNIGQLTVWRSAADQGLFDRKAAVRRWIAEGPDPCDDCLDMDGETTGLDEPWIMPDGTPVECPPWDVHPHCYCGMELEFEEET